MPKRRQEDPMKSNLQFVRIFMDREAIARLNRLAEIEGRSQQRQVGMMLERIAQLYREQPQKLVEIGLLSPMAIPSAAA